jgi:hypothetical protein
MGPRGEPDIAAFFTIPPARSQALTRRFRNKLWYEPYGMSLPRQKSAVCHPVDNEHVPIS